MLILVDEAVLTLSRDGGRKVWIGCFKSEHVDETRRASS